MKPALMFLCIIASFAVSFASVIALWLMGHPRACVYVGMALMFLLTWYAFATDDSGNGGCDA
jgi:hypothetical protein